MTLASCGGGGSGEGGSTAAAAGGETVQASTDRKPGGDQPGGEEPAAESASGSRAAAGCQARLGNFLDRMDDLRQSLLAGLSYDEYVVRVRAIRAAYEAVPVDQLGVACVTGAAAAAEDAFNQYLRAANAWGECAATAGCAASEVEGRLQRRWRIASKRLDTAERKRG